MKTKLLRSLMLIAVLSIGTHVFAHDFEVDGIYYNIRSKRNLTVEVTFKGNSYDEYDEYSGSVTIPQSVTYDNTTYSVISIGNDAFNSCGGLTNVVISNSITSIGNEAFYYCKGLTSVTIPNSVTTLGNKTFYLCNGLTSVTIGNSVTSLETEVFASCTSLTSITIPNSVTSLEWNSFYNCIGLTSIVVESGNAVYDSRDNCNAIIETSTNTLITGCKTTVIPNSVTTIGEYAFTSCTGLTSVTIPESVTSIGSTAFSGCHNLTSIVVERGNAVYDSRDNCNAIIETSTNTLITGCKTTVIPNSVTTIGNLAFLDCTGLTNVTIPNSVTTIGHSAFYYCTGLTNLTIPNSVTTIGYSAFYGCTGLTSVTIPNSITTIENFAFYGCTGLISVTIPNSVTSIEDMAFENCTGLTSVTIPNSVTSIGGCAFNYCYGLTSVTIGNSVTRIRNHAFSNCYGLASVISLNPTPPACETNVFYNVNTQNIPLTVPTESVSAYQYTYTWEDFTNIIGKNLSGVEETLADDVNVPTEYYDLNGARVLNPENGVYVKRQGNNVSKIIVK